MANGPNVQLKSNKATYDAEFFGYFDNNISEAEELQNEESENLIPQRIFTETLLKQAEQMEENNPSMQAARKIAGIDEGNSLMGAVKKLIQSTVNWKKEFQTGIECFYVR